MVNCLPKTPHKAIVIIAYSQLIIGASGVIQKLH